MKKGLYIAEFILILLSASFATASLTIEEARNIANQKAQVLLGRSVEWEDARTLTVDGQPLLLEFVSKEKWSKEEDIPVLDIIIDIRDGHIWKLDFMNPVKDSEDQGSYISPEEAKNRVVQIMEELGMPLREDWIIEDASVSSIGGTEYAAHICAFQIFNGYEYPSNSLNAELNASTEELRFLDYTSYPLPLGEEIPQPQITLEEGIQRAITSLGDLANYQNFIDEASLWLEEWEEVRVPCEKPTLARETQLIGFVKTPPHIGWGFTIRVTNLPPELSYGSPFPGGTKVIHIDVDAITGDVLGKAEPPPAIGIPQMPVQKKEDKRNFYIHKISEKPNEIRVLMKEGIAYRQKPIKCINRKGKIFLLADDLHLLGLKFDKSKFILQVGEKREKVEKGEIMKEKGKLYISARKVADLGKFNLTYNPKFKILKIERDKIEKQGNK